MGVADEAWQTIAVTRARSAERAGGCTPPADAELPFGWASGTISVRVAGRGALEGTLAASFEAALGLLASVFLTILIRAARRWACFYSLLARTLDACVVAAGTGLAFCIVATALWARYIGDAGALLALLGSWAATQAVDVIAAIAWIAGIDLLAAALATGVLVSASGAVGVCRTGGRAGGCWFCADIAPAGRPVPTRLAIRIVPACATKVARGAAVPSLGGIVLTDEECRCAGAILICATLVGLSTSGQRPAK